MRKHVIPATLSAALMLAAVVAFDGLRQTTATSQPDSVWGNGSNGAPHPRAELSARHRARRA